MNNRMRSVLVFVAVRRWARQKSLLRKLLPLSGEMFIISSSSIMMASSSSSSRSRSRSSSSSSSITYVCVYIYIYIYMQ